MKSAAVRRHAPVRSAPRFPARHTTGADGDAPPSSLPRSTIGPFRPAKTPSISTTTPPGAPAFFNARTASFAFAGVLNGRAADPSPASSPRSASTCRTVGTADTMTMRGFFRRNGFVSSVFTPALTARVTSSRYGAPMKPPAYAPFTVTAAELSPSVPSQTKNTRSPGLSGGNVNAHAVATLSLNGLRVTRPAGPSRFHAPCP